MRIERDLLRFVKQEDTAVISFVSVFFCYYYCTLGYRYSSYLILLYSSSYRL